MAGTTNAEMSQAWNGREGQDWARDWEHYDLAVRAYHERLLELADEARHVLDVGCGNGEVARDLARRGAQVLGVDLSAPMLDRARQLAAHLSGVTFLQADAEVHPFPGGAFDLVVSRFGAMFFADREAALRNLLRATRPGGRLLLLAWQPLAVNPWLQMIRSSLALGRDLPAPPSGAPGPFGLADRDGVLAVLQQAGYDEVRVEDLRLPMWMGSDVDDAFGFLGASGPVRGLLEGLAPVEQEEGRTALRAALAAAATGEGVRLPSAAWLIRARRPA
jgi:SAM-dependent methyltransferase